MSEDSFKSESRQMAQTDARWERKHGTPVPASEARERARRRRELGSASADYWDAYADEVESWSE